MMILFKVFVIFQTVLVFELLDHLVLSQLSTDFDNPITVRNITNWTLSDLIPKNYNSLVPSNEFPYEPVRVRIGIHVLSLLDVKESDQTFTADIRFRSEWKDSRLNLPKHPDNYPLFLDIDSYRKKLWTPDIYFRVSLSLSLSSLSRHCDIVIISHYVSFFIEYNTWC